MKTSRKYAWIKKIILDVISNNKIAEKFYSWKNLVIWSYLHYLNLTWNYSAVQSQKAVSAYLKSKHISDLVYRVT